MPNLRTHFLWYCQETQRSNRMSLLCRLVHYNKERRIDKKTAFILKNRQLICYKCNLEIFDELVVKRTKRTRHYHQICYDKLFH